MENLRSELTKGNTIEFSNERDLVLVWFSKTTQCFCIQLNAVVIESFKTFKVFDLKLQALLKRREIEYKSK